MTRGQRTLNITVPMLLVSGFVTFLVGGWIDLNNPLRAAMVVVLWELALVTVAVIGVLSVEWLAEWFGVEWPKDPAPAVLRDDPLVRRPTQSARPPIESRSVEADEWQPTVIDRQVQMFLRRVCWELVSVPTQTAPAHPYETHQRPVEKTPLNERRPGPTRMPPSGRPGPRK